MLYYLKVGGPLMWILFGMSIVSLTVILERTCFFCRRERLHNKNFNREIIKAVASDNMKYAMDLCEKENNSIGCTVRTFLCRCDRNGDFHHFDQLVKEIGIDEVGCLEKRLHILGIIGYTAPMIGLLGTVTGMIQAFQNLAAFGAGDATIVASGISQALVTTAGGLIIAIPTIIAYNLFNKKIEDTEGEIDKITTNLINILRKN